MRKGIFIYPFMIMTCFACTRTSEPNGNEEYFQAGIPVGNLDNQVIAEASGLAASASNPGFLWTHNDSGDEARIFLIDSLGHYRLTLTLEGIQNRDWEDIAVGPGPDSAKMYIYIGEIGDNDTRYAHKFIYRVEEPTLEIGQDAITLVADSIKFKLADQARDTETLMIDPLTRDLYIASKREEKINLYRLPYPQTTTEEMTAELVAPELDFSLIGEKKGYHSSFFREVVGGDISPDGTEVLIKTYSNVFYWKREKGTPLIDALRRKPELLPYEPEAQGEAITFDRKGRGYYTLSEWPDGTTPSLIFYKRK